MTNLAPACDVHPIDAEDDGRMANDMSVEQKLDALTEKVDALAGKVDSLDGKVNALDGKVNALDGKVNALDGKVNALDGKVEKLDGRMRIEFQETRRIINLGFERMDGFEERMKREFEKTSQEHFDHKDLLEKVIVHVRRRVERLEGPAPRRRR